MVIIFICLLDFRLKFRKSNSNWCICNNQFNVSFPQWNLSQSIANFDEVRFVSAHKLVILLLEEAEQTVGGSAPSVPTDTAVASLNAAKAILNRALEVSPPNPYWHTRLILQCAKVSLKLKEHSGANELLQGGLDYANMHNMGYIKSLFLFTRIMVTVFLDIHCLG